jgi:hypothetical protein
MTFPVELLSWTDDSITRQTCHWAQKTRLEITAKYLSGCFAVDAPLADQPDLRDALLDLPDDSLQRILNAPETFSLLSHDKKMIDSFGAKWLREAIAAERILCGDNIRTPCGKIWTALGDAQIETIDTHPVVRRSNKIGLGSTIDFDSHVARGTLKASSFRTPVSDFWPFSTKQRNAVERIIAEASDELSESAAPPALLVSALVQVIIPRIDTNNVTFRGSSNRGAPGRVIIYNPHIYGINSCNIISSLIHEAIHILLYICEHNEPIFHDMEYAHNTFVQSPFSGKSIHLLAMVHAIFVWYGIMNFFTERLSNNNKYKITSTYYLDFCISGFLDNMAWKTIAPHKNMIREDIVEQIKIIQSSASSQSLR